MAGIERLVGMSLGGIGRVKKWKCFQNSMMDIARGICSKGGAGASALVGIRLSGSLSESGDDSVCSGVSSSYSSSIVLVVLVFVRGSVEEGEGCPCVYSIQPLLLMIF